MRIKLARSVQTAGLLDLLFALHVKHIPSGMTGHVAGIVHVRVAAGEVLIAGPRLVTFIVVMRISAAVKMLLAVPDLLSVRVKIRIIAEEPRPALADLVPLRVIVDDLTPETFPAVSAVFFVVLIGHFLSSFLSQI